MIVSSYGVHEAGGIAFLIQGGGTTNLISPELRSPFQLQLRPRRMRCPHQIDLDTVEEAPSWFSDPLADACLPVPRRAGEKPKVLFDPAGRHEGLLRQLSRLCSPTQSLFRPIWWATAREAHKEYLCSNISPVIWCAAEVKHSKEIAQHLSFAEAFNRRVIILAKERLPLFAEVEWLQTELQEQDVAELPLEAMGAGALRQYIEDA